VTAPEKGGRAHNAPGLKYFPAIDTHLIESAFAPQTFRVRVVRPPRYPDDPSRYPVVYATDGNAASDMLMGLTRLLHAAEVESGPFILVSIGYPGESPVSGEILRGRDFTFAGCPDFCRGVAWPWADVLRPEDGAKDFNGAPEFQRFIGQELIPFIDARYATTVGDRTYFGHSAGGGFGLYTLFTQTTLFRNYLISSPVLSYDGRTPGGEHYERNDFMFDLAREFVAAEKTCEGVRLRLSVGSEEEFRPIIANWRFTSSVYRFVALLRSNPIPGLDVTSRVFQGETHITTWPLAFLHGVKALFGVSVPGNAANGGARR
jgi:predicted alpha/beta superfamily hydrolase